MAHVYDGTTGLVANLALSSLAAQIVGDWMSFLVSEAPRLEDLNGDGDQFDFVLFVQRVGAFLAEGILAVPVNEFAQAATDLNGDGDLMDEVVHVLLLDE